MKQRPRLAKYLWRRTVIPAIVIALILMALTAAGVHFLDRIHYNNLLLQANSQAATDQTELGKERYDVKLLINNSLSQINCYSLRSSYARSICSAHEHGNSSNNLL